MILFYEKCFLDFRSACGGTHDGGYPTQEGADIVKVDAATGTRPAAKIADIERPQLIFCRSSNNIKAHHFFSLLIPLSISSKSFADIFFQKIFISLYCG